MTIKDRILKSETIAGAMTGEDFMRESRILLIGALDEMKKDVFMKLSRREQEIYVEAMLKEMGIRIPAPMF